MYYVMKGYKTKERKIPQDPNDPVWKALEKIRKARIEAIRKAMETGEPFRDPLEGRFP